MTKSCIICALILFLLMAFRCQPEQIDLIVNNTSQENYYLLSKEIFNSNNNTQSLSSIYNENFLKKRFIAKSATTHLVLTEFELSKFFDSHKNTYVFYFIQSTRSKEKLWNLKNSNLKYISVLQVDKSKVLTVK